MPVGTRVCGQIVCPKGHTILVPRQTPSRIFQGQPNPPTERPKATFLCGVCGSQFPCSPLDFRPFRFERGDQGRPVPFLWHIAGECVLENCGRLKPIYFGYDASGREPDVRRHVFELIREVECERGHRFELAGESRFPEVVRQVEVIPILRQSDEPLP
jgi:hypothetical protein